MKTKSMMAILVMGSMLMWNVSYAGGWHGHHKKKKLLKRIIHHVILIKEDIEILFQKDMELMAKDQELMDKDMQLMDADAALADRVTALEMAPGGGSGGLSGYEIVWSVEVPIDLMPGAILMATIECPAGKNVMGGGPQISDSSISVAMIESYPLNATTWKVTIKNIGSSATPTIPQPENLTVHATCADAAPP